MPKIFASFSLFYATNRLDLSEVGRTANELRLLRMKLEVKFGTKTFEFVEDPRKLYF